jgi:hypothetical protein
VSKSSQLLDALFGWSQKVPPQVLDKCPPEFVNSHNSQIDSGEGKYVCFGPISLLNHSCNSPLSLKMDPDNESVSNRVLGIAILKAKREWSIQPGDEITLKYSEDFTDCSCSDCKDLQKEKTSLVEIRDVKSENDKCFVVQS